MKHVDCKSQCSEVDVHHFMQVETSIFAKSFKNVTFSLPPELDSVSCGLNAVTLFLLYSLTYVLLIVAWPLHAVGEEVENIIFLKKDPGGEEVVQLLVCWTLDGKHTIWRYICFRMESNYALAPLSRLVCFVKRHVMLFTVPVLL